MTDLKKRQLMQKYLNTKGISHFETCCGLTFKEFCEQEEYYEKAKEKFFKGDVILIWENGQPTNMSTNLDVDRELSVGDVFEWQPNKKWQPVKMKVLSIDFPLTVEEIA